MIVYIRDQIENFLKNYKKFCEKSVDTNRMSFNELNGEVLFCGQASWSLIGKSSSSSKGADYDGVEPTNILWGFHRLKPLIGIRIKKVISGPVSGTCIALAENGVPYLWGKNSSGQLGLGSTDNVYNPTLVDIPKGETIIGGACGNNHTLLYSSKGSLFAAGAGKCGQLGTGRRLEIVKNFTDVPINAIIVKAAAGRDFSIISDSNGVIYSFGHPEFGVLGNGKDGKTLERANKFSFEYLPTPKPILSLPRAYGDVKIVDIACGAKHVCAMDSEGRIYTWGFGAYGRLGHNDNKDQFEPMAVDLFSYEPPPPRVDIPKFMQHQSPKVRATQITCGNTCTYVVAGEPYNSLYMFGITKRSGEATMSPTIVDQVSNWRIKSVSAGNTSTICYATCFEESKIISWGSSPTFGELGYGENEIRSSTTSKAVEYLDDAVVHQVSSGICHSLIIVDIDDKKSREKVEALPTFSPAEIDPSFVKSRPKRAESISKLKRKNDEESDEESEKVSNFSNSTSEEEADELYDEKKDRKKNKNSLLQKKKVYIKNK